MPSQKGAKTTKEQQREVEDRAYRLNRAIKARELTIAQLANEIDRKLDNVQRALVRGLKGDLAQKAIISALEAHLGILGSVRASTRLGGYSLAEVKGLEGDWLIVRPDMYVDGQIATAHMTIKWNREHLTYTQLPMRPDYPWTIGGKIARFNKTNLFYFLESDNKGGRFPMLGMHFQEETKSFSGQMIGPATCVPRIATCPVRIVKWPEIGFKTGIITTTDERFASLREDLLRVLAWDEQWLMCRVK
jgi:hypothetical protein